MEVQLESIDQLYELIDKFKENQIEIKHLESIMVNFEEIFVNIVRSDEQ